MDNHLISKIIKIMLTAIKSSNQEAINANDSKVSLKYFLFEGGTICHPSVLVLSLPHEFTTRTGQKMDITEETIFSGVEMVDLLLFLKKEIKKEMRNVLEMGIKYMQKYPEDYSRVFSATSPVYGDSNHTPTEPGILEILARCYYELKSGGISRITIMSAHRADEITMMSDIQRAGREKHWTDKPQSGLAHSRIFQYVYL